MTKDLSYLVLLCIAIVPVFLFLFILMLLDSYKLVSLRNLLYTALAGCGVALLALLTNTSVFSSLRSGEGAYSRYGAPALEEVLKAAYIVYLLSTNKVGFLVDAAIYGFAVGAGFASAENIYYLYTLKDANPFLWVLRGFGTAVMHGGTTATLAIISKSLHDRGFSKRVSLLLPGLAMAVGIHTVFNHFVLSPLLSTASIGEKWVELRYLEKSIGPTGRLAIQPFLHASRRDLWQSQMLGPARYSDF